MDIRESAAKLSDAGRDKFLEAVIRLKHRPAPNGLTGVSVYDQFVALHGAVFAVIAPQLPAGETVNFGHWNIGFCAWHRQYLRELEKALQAEVPGVTIPYYDWSDDVGALSRVCSYLSFLARSVWGLPDLLRTAFCGTQFHPRTDQLGGHPEQPDTRFTHSSRKGSGPS